MSLITPLTLPNLARAADSDLAALVRRVVVDADSSALVPLVEELDGLGRYDDVKKIKGAVAATAVFNLVRIKKNEPDTRTRTPGGTLAPMVEGEGMKEDPFVGVGAIDGVGQVGFAPNISSIVLETCWWDLFDFSGTVGGLEIHQERQKKMFRKALAEHLKETRRDPAYTKMKQNAYSESYGQPAGEASTEGTDPTE